MDPALISLSRVILYCRYIKSETGERSDVADNAAGGVFSQSMCGGSGDVEPKRPDDQQRMEALKCLRHLCPDRREERGQAFHLEQMDNPRWRADAPAGLAIGFESSYLLGPL